MSLFFIQSNKCSQTSAFCSNVIISSGDAHFAKTMPYFWADRSDFKTVLEKIAQCFPSGITQFLNQHTSKYQKHSKHFVCRGLPDFQVRLCFALAGSPTSWAVRKKDENRLHVAETRRVPV